MNSRRWILIVLLVLLAVTAILAVAGPVAAKATRTNFTATETWVEDISPGKEWYTGDGKVYHLREAQQLYSVEASDPRLSGEEIITLNLNMKVVDPPVYITGPMWGTFRITNADGDWAGTWRGVRDERGFAFIEYVGSGEGGYAGLHLRVHDERLNPDGDTLFWTGYILDPGR